LPVKIEIIEQTVITLQMFCCFCTHDLEWGWEKKKGW